MALCEEEIWFRLRSDFLTSIDPLQLSKSLYENEIINQTVYQQIYQMSLDQCERTDICKVLLDSLNGIYSINLLTDILRKNGYHELANKMYCLIDSNESGVISVKKTSSKPNKKVHTFFKNVKRLVHNASFKNPRKALRKMASRFEKKLLLARNTKEEQRVTDKYVALLGAEIDAIAITFDEQLPENKIFNELKNLVSSSTNTLITDIIYYGRLANANAIGNNFEDGKRMLCAARQSAFVLDPCLERANVYYIEVYVRLWEFENNPTLELKDELIAMGHEGLKCLEHEDEDTVVLWTRMFILRMVFCLLGIGNRGNIISGYDPNNDSIHEAKYLLGRFDQFWDGIETRRIMFYKVARARLNELEGDVILAYTYAKTALELAELGKFKELVFIDAYLKKLEDMMKSFLVHENFPVQAGKNISFLKEIQGTVPDQNFQAASSVTQSIRFESRTGETPLQWNFPELHSYMPNSSSLRLDYRQTEQTNLGQRLDYEKGDKLTKQEISLMVAEPLQCNLQTLNSSMSASLPENLESEAKVTAQGSLENETSPLQYSFPVLGSEESSSLNLNSVTPRVVSNFKVEERKHNFKQTVGTNQPGDNAINEAMQINFPPLDSDTSGSLVGNANAMTVASPFTNTSLLCHGNVSSHSQYPSEIQTQEETNIETPDVESSRTVQFVYNPRFSLVNNEREDSLFGTADFACSFENYNQQNDQEYENTNNHQNQNAGVFVKCDVSTPYNGEITPNVIVTHPDSYLRQFRHSEDREPT